MYFDSAKKIRTMGIKIDSTLPIPPCALIKLFPAEWENFLDVHSSRVCMAGKSFGVISPDGYFRACIQAPFIAEFGGNVLKNWKQSWQNANNWAERRFLPDKCFECGAIDICGGGCRTSCLWENNGSVKGKTMYMGDPLCKDQSAVFIERLKVTSQKLSDFYRWRNGIKIRDEGWGIIIFNPSNQSFTILSPNARDCLKYKKNHITINSPKTAKTLLAIGAIRGVREQPQKVVNFPAQVLPANVVLPRLAANLNCAEDVYYARADTGERYFF
ncbi:MAG: SPASM domain-containing protein [bacterium]